MNKTEVLDGLDKVIGDVEPIRDPEGKSLSHLRWMIVEMKTTEFSDDKFNRWLGYIQGVLVVLGITTLNKERDRNR